MHAWVQIKHALGEPDIVDCVQGKQTTMELKSNYRSCMNELITCQLGYKSAKKSQIFLCNIEAFFLLDWMAIPSIIFGASSLSTIMVISIVKTVAIWMGVSYPTVWVNIWDLMGIKIIIVIIIISLVINSHYTVSLVWISHLAFLKYL